MNEKTVKNNKYVTACRKKNYDFIQIHVPKGEREKIKAHAQRQGMSMNEYIYNLIGFDMNND